MKRISKILTTGLASLALACSQDLPKAPYLNNFSRLENGIAYGMVGPLKFLVNEEGEVISKGYHTITPIEEGYKASVGACGYVLDNNGKIVSMDEICDESGPLEYQKRVAKIKADSVKWEQRYWSKK